MVYHASEGTRWYRKMPISKINGGDEGIRTLDGLLTHTPLAGERLRPLGHVSTGGISARRPRLQVPIGV